MIKRLLNRALVLGPSFIGLFTTLLITHQGNHKNIPSYYISALFFQVGGGVVGAFLGYRKFSNFPSFPFILLILVSNLINNNLVLFFAGVGNSFVLNNLIYSGKMFASLLIGYISPILLLISTVINVYTGYNTDVIYLYSVSLSAVILLYKNPSQGDFSLNDVNLNHLLLSLMFGITNLLVVFSYNRMEFVFAEKLYLALFSFSTLYYFRDKSVSDDFSLVVKMLNSKYLSNIEYSILFFTIIIESLFHFLFISLVLSFYFNAKASILFRAFQVKHLIMRKAFLIIVVIPVAIVAREFTMLTFWFILCLLLKNSLNEINL